VANFGQRVPSRSFTVDRESVEEAVVIGDAPSGSLISTYFVSLRDSNRLTSMIVGRWCASRRTNIWCPHDQVLAMSKRAMPRVAPASPRKLTGSR
jgi:hypothetical protein